MKYGVVLALALLGTCLPADAKECTPPEFYVHVDLVSAEQGRAEFVPVEIAGVKKLLLLDTGNSATLLFQSTVTELGLKVKSSGIRIYSVTGSYSDAAADAPMAIGGLKAPRFTFQVAPADLTFPGASGLLGADVLRQFDLSIDFGTNMMDIYGADHCEGNVVNWPERPLSVVPFERLSSGHIVFPVTIDDHAYKAILDTGASTSTINDHRAEIDFGLTLGSPDTPAVGQLNGEEGSSVWTHSFNTLSFGGVSIRDPHVLIIPDRIRKHFEDKELGSLISRPNEQIEPDVLIGMDVLRHLHIYFAYKEKKLYITPSAAQATSPR